MKNLKKITALMLCAVLVFTLFACGKKETASGEAEPVKWDFCVINSLTHPSSVLCQQFADEVYEKTDGMQGKSQRGLSSASGTGKRCPGYE